MRVGDLQKKVGVFAKDKVKGKFTDEWEAFLAADDRKASYEAIDVSPAVASIMAVKEKEEIVSCVQATARHH
jgi:nucleosome binding factor SPN SPT16 subunit